MVVERRHCDTSREEDIKNYHTKPFCKNTKNLVVFEKEEQSFGRKLIWSRRNYNRPCPYSKARQDELFSLPLALSSPILSLAPPFSFSPNAGKLWKPSFVMAHRLGHVFTAQLRLRHAQKGTRTFDKNLGAHFINHVVTARLPAPWLADPTTPSPSYSQHRLAQSLHQGCLPFQLSDQDGPKTYRGDPLRLLYMTKHKDWYPTMTEIFIDKCKKDTHLAPNVAKMNI